MSVIEMLIINSLYCVGIYNATGEGYLLHFVAKWDIPEFIRKPLFNCIYCMASIHSIAFAYYCGLTWYEWLFYIPALSAMNGIIYAWFDKLTTIEPEDYKIKINGFGTEKTDH